MSAVRRQFHESRNKVRAIPASRALVPWPAFGAIVFLAAACAVAQPRAFFKDGNALLAGLSAQPTTTQNAFAVGYVVGATEALNEEQQLSFKVCFKIPANATQRQLADVVKQYLEQFPTVRDLPAPWLVASSFERVFPCEKQQPSGPR